jgi:hypothetical protein
VLSNVLISNERLSLWDFDGGIMPRISATEALAYATHDELLKLYAVLVGSWVLTFLGQFLQASRSIMLRLIGFLVLLVGILGVLVGLVAIAHKVLADS